jgi:chitin disaccharide deacetylase
VPVSDIAELCGFEQGSRLLILHADDFGMCHSVNLAIVAAFEGGAISSASVMVPCPGFSEAAEWCTLHPQYDVGIHSTLISEWETYKWGPVSDGSHSSGLVDANGHFWPRNSLLRASPGEIEDEIAAQIGVAKERGISATHLDSHMLSVAHPEYILAYVKAGRRFALPVLIDEYWHRCCAAQVEAPDEVVVDNLLQAPSTFSAESLEEYYVSALWDLKPGLNELLLHPGFDDDELRSITGKSRAYGAAWRQRDFDVITGDRFKSALQENQIHVVDWRTIKSAITRRTSSTPRFAERADLKVIPPH